MPQTADVSVATYRERIARLQAAMKSAGVSALVLESGGAMLYLTGVRWGRSERTFAVVIPASGDLVWVLPGFEEQRARELIRLGNDDIRVWQEDENPFARIVEGLKARGIVSGKVAIDDSARFFVFDGIRRLAPKLEFTGSLDVLRAAGIDLSLPTGRPAIRK